MLMKVDNETIYMIIIFGVFFFMVGIIIFASIMWLIEDIDFYVNYESYAEEACKNTYGVGLNDTYRKLVVMVECNNGIIGELDKGCIISDKWGNCEKKDWVIEK